MSTMTPSSHPYDALTPDLVLDAIEAEGYYVNGRLFGLNSYENRVYQVGIEDDLPVIAKFYRPQRWSEAQIREEHLFCRELADAEIPVVAPLPLKNGDTLGRAGDFLFCLFPQRGGQAPDVSEQDTLYRLGQWLGRIHAIGATKPFEARPTIQIVEQIDADQRFLLDNGWIPDDLRASYEPLVRDILVWCDRRVTEAGAYESLRLHGDCHAGNMLVRQEQMLFVDFDDARNGPAIQDLWLLLNGRPDEQAGQFSELLEGYEMFRDFPYRERVLIEPLRARRLITHTAWLAQRWEDPAFPRSFPWFGQARFWADHILALREQLAALQAPALALPGQS